MNKIKLIGTMIIIFIVGFAVGMVSEKVLNEKYNDESNDYLSDIDNFLGTWSALEYSQNESQNNVIYYTWSFYENRTVHLVMDAENETFNKTIVDTWRGFDVSENELEIETPDGSVLQYAFSFSDDKNELTLSKDGKPMVFQKS